MKFTQAIFLILIGTLLSSCAALNPASTNLKSPCVANDDGTGSTPCVKRKPVENPII